MFSSDQSKILLSGNGIRMNYIAKTIVNPRKNIGQAGNRIIDLLFSCPVSFRLSYAGFPCKNDESTVKPVLETTCIKRPSALKHHCSDTTTLLNPFPNKPCFLGVCSTSLLKTLWEQEKLLITSNFSFSHIVTKKQMNKCTAEKRILTGFVLERPIL